MLKVVNLLVVVTSVNLLKLNLNEEKNHSIIMINKHAAGLLFNDFL